MADNVPPPPPPPPPPNVKRKSMFERAIAKKTAERERAKTRVVIGSAFQRWRQLKDREGLRTDAEVALFLLDSYEKISSTPVKSSTRPPPPAVSTICSETMSDRNDDIEIAGVEELQESPYHKVDFGELDTSISSLDLNTKSTTIQEFNDIVNSTIDWDDVTWHTGRDTASVSTLEEGDTKEVDSDDDDSDDADFVPRIRVRYGGTLQTNVCLEELPAISLEEAVHGTVQHNSAEHVPLTESLVVAVEDDIIGHGASIAYHDCLKQLADYLILPVGTCKVKDPQTQKKCSAERPYEVCIKNRGTAAIIEWMCPRGHTVWRWSSQPSLKYGMSSGDFMLATNILLSGNNYAKIALLFKFMNMGMVNRSTFFAIQNNYCVDSITEFWNEKRSAIIDQLHSKGPVVVLGDGRMDSPGFCAQYCTYTAMDNDSKKVISMISLDKRETQRNSVAMEKEGFMRTIDSLRKDLDVQEVCTDGHLGIKALFSKGIYKDIGVVHCLDIWHGSKNLSKKIVAAGQQKSFSILLQWDRDICNHFWYCCKTAGTYEEFFDMWVGLLHHVTGEHEWALGACRHGPLVDSREKDWIVKSSPPHQKLREIILDTRWLKNAHLYLPFRSTADLESFHNHILMYASKRHSFSPQGYKARTLLAGLDYNHHLDRPAKRKKDGSIQFGKTYNKRSRTWRLSTIKVDKDFSYIPALQSTILQRRLTAPGGLAQSRPSRPEDPRRLGVLSGIPAPSVEELLQKQHRPQQIRASLEPGPLSHSFLSDYQSTHT